jgi:hypothetical protein
MIETTEQYQKAQEELRHLEGWLQRLQKDHPVPAKGLTKACCPLSALIPVLSANLMASVFSETCHWTARS